MGIFFKWNTYFPNVHLVSPIPCLSLHGLIVAHLRDWHCYLLVFTEFSICKDLRIHIRSWSNCCLAMQLLWLHTKNIHFKGFTIQNTSFILYIDICKCWKLNHNYWKIFKVTMFYSTVSGLFLFFSPEHWCVHKSSLNIRSVTIDDKLVNEGSLICVPCGMK